MVEEQVCTSLLRPYYGPIVENGAIFAAEGAIYANRITEYLRPASFNGGLRDSYAAIVPFNASRVAAVDTVARNRLEKGILTDKTRGCSVVYGGDMYSSAEGYMGKLFLEEFLFLDRPFALYGPGISQRRKGENHLRRVIGPQTFIEKASEVAMTSMEESISRSLRSARYALTHLYPGGLPGSKR